MIEQYQEKFDTAFRAQYSVSVEWTCVSGSHLPSV